MPGGITVDRQTVKNTFGAGIGVALALAKEAQASREEISPNLGESDDVDAAIIALGWNNCTTLDQLVTWLENSID